MDKAYEAIEQAIWFRAMFIRMLLGMPVRLYVGIAEMLTVGLTFLFTGVFAIVILAVFGQFASIAAIWPAANVTKITTNIANSVVVGAAFLSILVILIMVGFLFVVIAALQAILR